MCSRHLEHNVYVTHHFIQFFCSSTHTCARQCTADATSEEKAGSKLCMHTHTYTLTARTSTATVDSHYNAQGGHKNMMYVHIATQGKWKHSKQSPVSKKKVSHLERNSNPRSPAYNDWHSTPRHVVYMYTYSHSP